MPTTLYESAAQPESKSSTLPQTSITPGIVENNCDQFPNGKVLVRLPSLNQEVWARLTAPGAGRGTGFLHTPNIKDEVLVALIHSDPVDAYIIGGLWSTVNPPPIVPESTNAQTKRVIRTGVQPGVGHEVEFDDALQSITITTSMTPAGQQRIKMDSTGTTLQNLAGTIKISMDNLKQVISIESLAGIELKSESYIKLDAKLISIESTGPCVVSGRVVKIN